MREYNTTTKAMILGGILMVWGLSIFSYSFRGHYIHVYFEDGQPRWETVNEVHYYK